MKKECPIVRDLLPLYLENMVSEETAAFIRAHLEQCKDCAAEREAMETGSEPEENGAGCAESREKEGAALVAIKRKLRRKTAVAMGITAACLLAVVVLLQIFPVYRILQVEDLSFYSMEELAQLAFVGEPADRAAARAVLRQADAAFHDCTHTREENEEAYGLLARYATARDRGASFVTHSIELWSAHLGPTEGDLWVFYSQEVYDDSGKVLSGSRKIPSLWHVEKDETGAWVVVGLKEHP